DSNFRKNRCSFASNLDKKAAQLRTGLSTLAARVPLNAATVSRCENFRGWGHGIPVANGILAWVGARAAAERQLAARAEVSGRRRRRYVRRAGRLERHAAFLRAPA